MAAVRGRYGTCEDMCCVEERRQRVELRVWHPLETEDGEPTPLRMVAVYRRPAAGVSTPPDEQLRSEAALTRTVHWLCSAELMAAAALHAKRGHHWMTVAYAFVMDRLRAVRAEITLSDSDSDAALSLCAICVRYALLSLPLLASLPPEQQKQAAYEPLLHERQLAQSLSQLRRLCERRQERLPPLLAAASFLLAGAESRPSQPLRQIYALPKEDRAAPALQLAAQLLAAAGGLCPLRYFRLVGGADVPLLLAAAAVPLTSAVRSHALSALNKGCFKRERMPVDWLRRQLLFAERTGDAAILTALQAAGCSLREDGRFSFSGRKLELPLDVAEWLPPTVLALTDEQLACALLEEG